MNARIVHTAGPNTALVKSGGKNDVRIVIGGRLLAIPVFQRVDRLSLELRTITVHTTRGTTINGVGVDVTSCIQVKIQGWSSHSNATQTEQSSKPHHRVHHDKNALHIDYNAIRLAAQHFIGKKDGEIEGAIQKTIAGHQRAIIGTLTVEELYRDRAAFSQKVLDLCSEDMRNMGLSVVSYTVAEITDEQGYIRALGVRQEEKVKRDAAEGKAIHQNQAIIRAAEEDAASYAVSKQQSQLKIESDKVTDLKQLEKQRVVDMQRAVMEKAHSIASAEQDAILLVRRQEARAKEVEAELNVMKQKVLREKLEKEQKIHIEADSQLYKARQDAEGIRAVASAEAEKVRLIGQANGQAIEARGLAEMRVLKERNEIWKERCVITLLTFTMALWILSIFCHMFLSTFVLLTPLSLIYTYAHRNHIVELKAPSWKKSLTSYPKSQLLWHNH